MHYTETLSKFNLQNVPTSSTGSLFASYQRLEIESHLHPYFEGYTDRWRATPNCVVQHLNKNGPKRARAHTHTEEKVRTPKLGETHPQFSNLTGYVKYLYSIQARNNYIDQLLSITNNFSYNYNHHHRALVPKFWGKIWIRKKIIRHNKQFFIRKKEKTKDKVCIQTGLEEVPPNYKVASLDWQVSWSCAMYMTI